MLGYKILTISALSLQALAAPTSVAPIPGYDVSELQRDVELFPGKPSMSLTGTAESVRRQAIKLNPRLEEGTYLADDTNEGGSTNLNKRLPVWKNLECGNGPFKWQSTSVSVLNDKVIPYLGEMKGLPRIPGNSCAPVKCAENAGVWWCNDNKDELQLRGYEDIAEAASRVTDRCSTGDDVVGQVFVEGNWNVIVRAGCDH